jgi:hypothetical protein
MNAYEIGQRVGRQWTRGYGKTEEINRVVSLTERTALFRTRSGDEFSPGERVALVALGNQGLLGRADAARFWQWLELVSDRAGELVHDAAFARGFVHGAYDAWTRRAA